MRNAIGSDGAQDNLLANIDNGISAILVGPIGFHLGMKPRVLDRH
jgi:hypothetical protein